MALERSTARAPRGTSGAALTGLRASPALRGPFGGVAACVAAVAIVTAAIWLLEPHVPVLSLGVLYVFAVLPVAVAWGWLYAVPVAVASMLAFNFFFLPPKHTLTLADSRNWLALAVYLTTAVVVGSLASRARRRADEAEQREREAALLADVAAELLRGNRLEEELARIEERTADVIGVSSVRIVLGKETGGARAHEAPHPLSVDGRPVATVYTPEREEGALRIQQQLLPALASLLAVAHERERLEREAFGAEALRRSDAIKTALIQAVSHDLRTPLATIEQALDGLESGVLALDGGGSRAAAPDDSSGAHAPQAARREPSRPLAAPGGSRRVDPGALDRGPARGAGAGGAPRFHPRTGQYPARSAGCERQRRPDPARTGERARERTQGVAPGRARPHACQRDEARAPHPRHRSGAGDPGGGARANLRAVPPRARRAAISEGRASASRSRGASPRRTAAGSGSSRGPARVRRSCSRSPPWSCPSRFRLDRPARARRRRRAAVPACAADEPPGRGVRRRDGDDRSRGRQLRRPASSRGDHPRPPAAGRAGHRRVSRAAAVDTGAHHRRLRGGRGGARRSPRSTPARTTTSPSRSRSESCSRGCARCCDGSALRPSPCSSWASS